MRSKGRESSGLGWGWRCEVRLVLRSPRQIDEEDAVEGTLVDAERRVEPIELIGLARELEILALTSTIPVIACLSPTPLLLLSPLALRHLDCTTLT